MSWKSSSDDHAGATAVRLIGHRFAARRARSSSTGDATTFCTGSRSAQRRSGCFAIAAIAPPESRLASMRAASTSAAPRGFHPARFGEHVQRCAVDVAAGVS